MKKTSRQKDKRLPSHHTTPVTLRRADLVAFAGVYPPSDNAPATEQAGASFHSFDPDAALRKLENRLRQEQLI